MCSFCFDVYSDSCLGCADPSYLDYNGQCLGPNQKTCPTGYPENGYCVGDDKCFDEGCAVCSSTGFCYQCLPDYIGEPTCKWEPLLPAMFMVYWTIPFWIFALVSVLVVGVKHGVTMAGNQGLFSVSLLEMVIWCFIIPAFYHK